MGAVVGVPQHPHAITETDSTEEIMIADTNPTHLLPRPAENSPELVLELPVVDSDFVEDNDKSKDSFNMRNQSWEKPLEESDIVLVQEFILNDVEGGNVPEYRNITCLSDGKVVILDKANCRCLLYNSSYKYLGYFQLSSKPSSMCALDSDEIAISLPDEKIVQFLKISDPLQLLRYISTRRRYLSIAALNKRKLVYCGSSNTISTYYWGVITTDGKEESCFHIPRSTVNHFSMYLALNSAKTRVYISCSGVETLYSFGLDGKAHFKYDLKDGRPYGILLDREDNVYVVVSKHNTIHMLTSEGHLQQIFKSMIPRHPIAMSFQPLDNHFLLTCATNVCSVYKLT